MIHRNPTNETTPTIADFMTSQPCVVDEGLSLADAMDRMLANNIRHLVVVRGQQMVGVVDSSDLGLANAITQQKLRDIPVSRATRGVCQCPHDMPLTEVARMMEAQHYGCVVATEGGRIVGIFTATDALRALRSIVLGHSVEPQVVPTHRPDVAKKRESTPPHARARRMLEARGAAPSSSDGLLFGRVGV